MFNQFTKEDLIKDLRENIYCRLGQSKIHGITFIAIRNIPKGINPFVGLRTTDDQTVYIPKSEIQADPLIPEAIKKMVDDFYVADNGNYCFPQFGLNEMGIAFYVNHSETPNLREEGDEFYTTRPIKTGEELTANYRTYAENL